MESPRPHPVSGEQRARLLELEERQRLLKRLCEEALKEEEQHEHIFQQLEEHTTAAMSTVGSFALNGAAGLNDRPLSPGAKAEPLDDLLTGEVQSFRDPNSVARASSSGSAAAVPGLRVGWSPHPHSLSVDPSRSQLDNKYRPPACPLSRTSTGYQPPPPPRAVLYSTSRKPLEEGHWAASAGAHRKAQPLMSAPVISPPGLTANTLWHGEKISADIILETNSFTTSNKSSTYFGDSHGTYTRATDHPLPAASAPLSPPPPPPPPARSRSPSATLQDRYQRSDRRFRHGIPPPPPPPPASHTAYATGPPLSGRYSRIFGTRTGLEPPPSPPPPLLPPSEVSATNVPPPLSPHASAPYLISPDEATEEIPPPFPSMRNRASATRDVQHSMAGAHRDSYSLPDANPLPPASRTAHTWRSDDSSMLSTASTERDIARWTHRSSVRDALRLGSDSRDRHGYDRNRTAAQQSSTTRPRTSASAGLAERPTPRASATARPAAYHRENTTQESDKLSSRAPRCSPPPPVSGAAFLPSPARYGGSENESGLLLNRWETASLTSSLRGAEERHLRSYFAKADREVVSRAQKYRDPESYNGKCAWGPRTGVNNAATGTFKSSDPMGLPLHRCSPAAPALAPFALSESMATDVAPPAAPMPEPKTTALHPYGSDQPRSLTSAQERSIKSTAAKKSDAAPGYEWGAPVPPLSALHTTHQQTPSLGLDNGSRNSVWAEGLISPPAQSNVCGMVSSVKDYFDVGPEKEALLSLLGGGTRGAQESDAGPAPSRNTQCGEKMPRYPPSTRSLSDRNKTQSVAAPLGTTTTPPSYSDPKEHHSYTNPSVETTLQQKCEAAQAKTETLARHLVKAISDRKLLKDNVEQLELLVEECNAEVGRLQQIVEEQHQDSATSLGVQAALRAKEREVAVYEDEIRRLNGVLDGYLTRSASSKRVVEDSMQHALVVKEAEVEAAMEEVGLAHLAQREAEERANQLANELCTAVEQIQFLDERLAEMERAVAAARFQAMPARIVEDQDMAVKNDHTALSRVGASTCLAVPSNNEMHNWPVEARQAVLQLAAQAEGLLMQNAEGERHASLRLQHIENTCSELQRNLRQRSEEVGRARETCEQLRHEKTALQTVGEQWYQQLHQVKEDAQLVSEMVRTAREDAEDVYLSSRVAAERAVEHQAAVATASPLRPISIPAPTDPATLKKSARFAQQVMHDFQAIARFLASLRTMNIGDRNGYEILQIIASGRNPAEGLYVTADNDATPKRLRECLSLNAASETNRRVQERKARVLRAVEQALFINPDSAPKSTSLNATENPSPNHASSMLGLPSAAVRRPLTMETEVCEDPDAFEDVVGNEDDAEVEVVFTSLHPSQAASKSLRDGSNGMVHSDVRQRPVPDAAPYPPRKQVSPTFESSSVTETSTVSLPSIPLAPTGNMTRKQAREEGVGGPGDALSPQHRMTQAVEALPTPPQSVARPLRLSVTPSQPRSDGKGDYPEDAVSLYERQSNPTGMLSSTAQATGPTLTPCSDSGVHTGKPLKAPSTLEPICSPHASAPHRPSRLRSPTPDRRSAASAAIHIGVSDITTPIEQAKAFELLVDEPLPRLGSEDTRQSLPLGYQPKDRSTTARPSSTPHTGSHSSTRRSRKEGDGEEAVGLLQRTGRRQRGASDADDDDVIFRFRDPPCGEVQEVTLNSLPAAEKRHHSPLKVYPRSATLHVQSLTALSEAVASSPISSHCSSVMEEEADIEERNVCTDAQTADLALHHKRTLKQTSEVVSPVSSVTSAPLKGSAAKKASAPHRSSVDDDDDDEPSLSFSVPAAQARPLHFQSTAEKIAQGDALRRNSISDEALLGMTHLRRIPGTGDAAVASSSASPSPASNSGSLVGSLSGGSRQPRRTPAPDSGPSLIGLAGAAAAPPRLQRSSGSSAAAAAAQSLLGTSIPGPVAAIGAAVGVGRRSRSGSGPAKASVSLDRPMLDTTPALAEPRRASPTARLEPVAVPKNTVTTHSLADPSVGMGARASTPVEQTWPLSTGPETLHTNPVGVICGDEVDLLRSESRITDHTGSSTPARRLPSVTSTATPGSPLHVMETSLEALSLPGAMCNDKPDKLDGSLSLPAELPQRVPEQTRDLPARAGRKATPHSSPYEGTALAPLPTVNADTPESSSLNLGRGISPLSSLMKGAATSHQGQSTSSPAPGDGPSPATSPISSLSGHDGVSSVPHSTLSERKAPEEAVARRREDIANILKRIRAKKEDEKQQCLDASTPTSSTASENAAVVPENVNPST